MPTFSLRFSPLLIAFCLLPCLFAGRAEAQVSNSIPDRVFDLTGYPQSGGDGVGVPSVTLAGSGAYNLNNATVTAAAANQPTRTYSGLAGRPMYNFNGTSQFFSFSSDHFPQSPLNFMQRGSYSFVFVYTPTVTGAASGNLFAKQGGNNGRLSLQSQRQFGVVARVGLTNLANPNDMAGATGTGYIVTYIYQRIDDLSGKETLFINGVQKGQQSINWTGLGPDFFTVGTVGAAGDNTNYYLGSITAMDSFSHALTPYERGLMENYLSGTYGISVTAPATTLSAPGVARSVAVNTTTNSVTQPNWVWGQTAQSLTLPYYTLGGNYFGGTAPYTYEWHRSATSGFTPSAGDIVGTNSITLSDTGLAAGTTYYYVCKITDSAGAPATVTTPQFSAATCQIGEGNIGIIGDSISVLDPGTPGTSATPNYGSPSDAFALSLSRTGGTRQVFVVNRGNPGTTTNDWQPTNTTGPYANILTSAEAAFAAAKVKYVMIMLGVNDVHSGYEDGPITAATFTTRLTVIVNHLTGLGYTVILNAPGWGNWEQPTPLLPQYAAAMQGLANGQNVLMGDTTATAYFRDNAVLVGNNGPHPNNEGARTWGTLWATAFYSAVVKPTGTKRRIQ